MIFLCGVMGYGCVEVWGLNWRLLMLWKWYYDGDFVVVVLVKIWVGVFVGVWNVFRIWGWRYYGNF